MECEALFSAHTSQNSVVCDTCIPVFSSFFGPLASRTSFSIFLLIPFHSPSTPFFLCYALNCLLYPVTCPQHGLSSLLCSPKMHSSRSALPRKVQGGEEGQQPSDYTQDPAFASCENSVNQLRTLNCISVICDMEESLLPGLPVRIQ